MATRLVRARYYNPYFIENSNEVHEICFYNPENGEIIVKTRWFSKGGRGNNDYQQVEFPFDIIRKNKMPDVFPTDKGFRIKATDTYAKNGSYDIYIPAPLVNTKLIKDEITYTSETNGNARYTTHTVEIPTAETNRHDEVYKTTTIEIMTFKGYEPTEESTKIQQIKEKLEKANVKISSYDIEKILRVYDLIEK